MENNKILTSNVDNDATALNPNGESGLLKSANNSLSFFSVLGNAVTDKKLKYTNNVIDETVAEDNDYFVKEKSKFGRIPVIKTKRKKNVNILPLFVVIIASLLIIGSITVLTSHSPKRLTKLIYLGDKYLSELNYTEAIAAYSSALRIDGKNKDIYIGLAKSYLGLNDYEKAIEVLDQAIAIIERNDDLVNLRRKIRLESNDEIGLFLNNGNHVENGGTIKQSDIGGAFLYYRNEDSVGFNGLLTDSRGEAYYDSDLARKEIKPNSLLFLKECTLADEMTDGMLTEEDSILMTVYITDGKGNHTEYKYHVVE